MWKQDINRIRSAKASDSTGNVCNKMWNKYIYIFKGIKEKDIVRSKDQESKTFPNSSFKRAFVLSRFSRVWLFVTLCTVDGQSSSVHGLRQARILEWLPCPPPGKLPNPEIDHASLMSLALVGRLFTTGATWEAPLKEQDILIEIRNSMDGIKRRLYIAEKWIMNWKKDLMKWRRMQHRELQ